MVQQKTVTTTDSNINLPNTTDVSTLESLSTHSDQESTIVENLLSRASSHLTGPYFRVALFMPLTKFWL